MNSYQNENAERTYICIDLKSFYASVECVDRGLDPMKVNLVVADSSRTEKTICLAVSPALKKYGIPGRARLFEVIQKVKKLNEEKRLRTKDKKLVGYSYFEDEISNNEDIGIDYIVATPKMAHYIQVSTQIYNIYLKYIAPEDIHVYSIDEVFMDVTDYLECYKLTAQELAMKMILDVINTTNITATAGIGTNMYLAKVAMDIHAKHMKADKNGVRIATLDEMSYRKNLWDYMPITDFWRVGSGYAKKLSEVGLYTMGDIARCSLGNKDEYYNEDLLYKLFGVNAELLIDHAWGWEPCTMKAVKEYKPASNSIGSAQVLTKGYDFKKARLIVWEMTDVLALSLVQNGLITDQLILHIGYDAENLKNSKSDFAMQTTTDRYGRKVPKHTHATVNLDFKTSSSKVMTKAVLKAFDSLVDKSLLIRRVGITANRVVGQREAEIEQESRKTFEQLDMLVDYELLKEEENKRRLVIQKENRAQRAIVDIQNKYGKNAALKASNLKEGATTIERNRQIGGHKA